MYADEDNEDLSDLGLSLNKSKSPTIPEENVSTLVRSW